MPRALYKDFRASFGSEHFLTEMHWSSRLVPVVDEFPKRVYRLPDQGGIVPIVDEMTNDFIDTL